MKTAIFLGAGASNSDGAPLQSDILSEYFKSNSFMNNRTVMDESLTNFFKYMFEIDVENMSDNELYPKFEEALGMLDLANERGEAFAGFSGGNQLFSKDEVSHIRIYFVFLLAALLNEKVKKDTEHKKLVQNLKNAGKLDDIIFISTNYDMLIDNALRDVIGEDKVRYGIEFLDKDVHIGNGEGTDLLKVHGSLNWMYCPTCNRLARLDLEEENRIQEQQMNTIKCKICGTNRVPIMVPPTYYKDMTNIYLSTIWHKTEQKLLEADHIVFCGYSFQNADMHIKYLLKRVQVNRAERNLKITVVNDYTGKKEARRQVERNRYNRFFGDIVDFKNMSFEDFSNDPMKVL